MVNWAAHHVSRLAPRSVAPHPNRSPTPVSKGTMGMRACRTCGKGTYRRRPFNFCNACRPSFRGLHRMPAEVQEQMLVDRFHTPVKQAFEVNPGALEKAVWWGREEGGHSQPVGEGHPSAYPGQKQQGQWQQCQSTRTPVTRRSVADGEAH